MLCWYSKWLSKYVCINFKSHHCQPRGEFAGLAFCFPWTSSIDLQSLSYLAFVPVRRMHFKCAFKDFQCVPQDCSLVDNLVLFQRLLRLRQVTPHWVLSQKLIILWHKRRITGSLNPRKYCQIICMFQTTTLCFHWHSYWIGDYSKHIWNRSKLLFKMHYAIFFINWLFH